MLSLEIRKRKMKVTDTVNDNVWSLKSPRHRLPLQLILLLYIAARPHLYFAHVSGSFHTVHSYRSYHLQVWIPPLPLQPLNRERPPGTSPLGPSLIPSTICFYNSEYQHHVTPSVHTRLDSREHQLGYRLS